MIIVAKSVFQEGSKYYPKVFSDKCFYYDRTDVSESIDINKTSASKECIICY